MLKRSFILLLTFLFLYNSAGHVSVLSLLKERICRSIALSNAAREAHLVRFSRNDSRVLLARDRDELSHGGKLYDIVRADAGYYYCSHDEKEEGLLHEIAEFIKTQLGDPKSSKSKTGKAPVKDYLVSERLLAASPARGMAFCFVCNTSGVQRGFPELVLPPPRMI